jgi:hypothetical protein
MRTGKHVARSYSPPVLRYDYRGLRQIAKRLGWSVKRVLRTKQRDRNFPLSITFVGRQWCYVLYEERLQQWFTAGETVTHDHVLRLKGLSGAKMPPPPRESEPEPVSHEPSPVQPEELGVGLPKAPESPAASQAPERPPSEEPCPCGVPSRCLAGVYNEGLPEMETARPTYEEPPKPAPVNPAPPVNQRPVMVRPEGCSCGTQVKCFAH